MVKGVGKGAKEGREAVETAVLAVAPPAGRVYETLRAVERFACRIGQRGGHWGSERRVKGDAEQHGQVARQHRECPWYTPKLRVNCCSPIVQVSEGDERRTNDMPDAEFKRNGRPAGCVPAPY